MALINNCIVLWLTGGTMTFFTCLIRRKNSLAEKIGIIPSKLLDWKLTWASLFGFPNRPEFEGKYSRVEAHQ